MQAKDHSMLSSDLSMKSLQFSISFASHGDSSLVLEIYGGLWHRLESYL